MRKILKAPNNLVRRVLSKASNISQSSSHDSSSKSKKKNLMSEEQQLAAEIKALRDQIENLKAAISALQDDTEKKEVALANFAREKEKLTMELLKQKRSNNSLLHQLEDERKFYYREKELYCQEMNEFKKIKRAMSSASTNTNSKDDISVEHYKRENAKIKLTLNQTLEANYNLSIKFLRMKNTKTCLKTELKTMQLEHKKLVNDYKTKIENLSEELNELINEKINSPISSSDKKYLQLVKQNSCLVYENLYLQLKIDNMLIKFEKLKLEKNRSETNSKLKYIKHESLKPKSPKKATQKEHKRVRIKDDRPEKLEKDIANMPSTSRMCKTKESYSHQPSKEEILKIFERNKLPGIPDIKMLGDLETPRPSVSNKPIQIPTVQEKVQKQDEARKSMLMKNVLDKPNSKLALFQVSNVSSRTSISTNAGLLRVHSSPDIVQCGSVHKN